jgi:hypothetical protein
MKAPKNTFIKLEGSRYTTRQDDYEFLIRVEDFPSLKRLTPRQVIKMLKHGELTEDEYLKLRDLRYDNLKPRKIIKDKIEIDEIVKNEGSPE